MSSKIFKYLLIAVVFLMAAESIFGQTWTTLQGPAKARNERDIAVSNDGQTLYTCDKSVLFKSINGGTNWLATGTPNNELAAPLVITCKPDVPNVAVVGKLDSLKRSANGGDNWTVPPVGPNLTPLRLSISPINTQMYLGRQGVSGVISVMYSSNGGINWYNPPTAPIIGTSIFDIAPYPVAGTRSQHVWACGSDPSGAASETNPNAPASVRGVWRSTDLGSTWTGMNMGDFNVRAIAIADQSTPFIYAGTSTGKLYRSDEGAAWTLKDSYQASSSATTISAIRVRPVSNIVFVASDKGIHRSTDGGNSWSDLTPNPSDKSILALSIANGNQDLMYATTANTIYKSINGGSTWIQIDNGLGRMPLSSTTMNGNNSWMVSGQYPDISKYDGTTWSKATINNFTGYQILYHPANLLFASGGISQNQQAALYKSSDGGTSFSSFGPASTSDPANVFMGTVFDPNNTTRMFLYGLNNGVHLYLGSPTTSSWSPITITGAGQQRMNSVTIDGTTSGTTQKMYAAAQNNKVYRSTTAGVSWNEALTTSSPILSLSTNLAGGIVYAAGDKLWKTVNSGSNWSYIRSEAFKSVIQSPGFTTSGNYVAAVTNDGNMVYYSGDGGSTWVEVSNNLPKPINELRAISGATPIVLAATENGAYQIGRLSQQPNLLSPVTGSSNQATNITLTWSPVAGAVAYHLIVDDNSDFSSPTVNNKFITTTSYQVPGLTGNTMYYWKVFANNIVGDDSYTPHTINNFTTMPVIALTVTASDDGTTWSKATIANFYFERCNDAAKKSYNFS